MAITEVQAERRERYENRPNGRFIFYASRVFYEQHHAQLAKGYGMVARANTGDGLATLLFSAEDSPREYTWQLVLNGDPKSEIGSKLKQKRHSNGVRTVFNLDVDADGQMFGWQADHTWKGDVVAATLLDDDALLEVWAGTMTVWHEQLQRRDGKLVGEIPKGVGFVALRPEALPIIEEL